jgi:hypothetical protein
MLFVLFQNKVKAVGETNDSTYFYGEILKLKNYNGTEILLNEVDIDVGESSVENTTIIKNSTSENISTIASIKLEDEKMGIGIKNLDISINGKSQTDIKIISGNYVFNVEIPAGEAKKIVVKYQTNSNLENDKVIKYSLQGSRWKNINAFKINVKLPEEDIPLVKNIYPQCYKFEDSTITAEYYNFNVNVLTQDVIIEKETYKDLLYGRENSFSDNEIAIIKNAKDWINSGIYVDYNKYLTENLNYIKDKNIKIVKTEAVFKDLLKINENISTKNVIESIMEYALNRQLVTNGENNIYTSSIYNFSNENEWEYPLTKDYIIENSSNEVYSLKDKKICIDYVESEGDKILYVKKNVSGGLEENTQMETVKTSEWNILRTKNSSNWSGRPETGEKIIHVGVGITGEKLNATEEEKIEYVNMINPDLYIRKVIYDDNAKTTYTYITTDNSGKQIQKTEEGYIPIMVGYYNEKQKEVAKQYITFKDEHTPENYYNDQYYSVTTRLFSNETIKEKCLVPTIAQSVGFINQEDGKYIVEFFKFGKSNGLGAIKEAIGDNTAQNLVKINQIKNEEIKTNAENEINYAIIKNDTGEENSENSQDEKKGFELTTQNIIVLAIIGASIIICLIIIIGISIMKKKNN